MKNLIFINGTMGAGKTTVSHKLLKLLDRAVWLDGDWCWNADPFIVTDETKAMVTDNITHLLRSFLTCSEYENIIFCWVMQEQSIINSVLEGLDGLEFQFRAFTLKVSASALEARIMKDVKSGIRTPDVLERSLQRLPLYDAMDTVKIDVSSASAQDAAQQIRNRLCSSDAK